MKIFDLLNEDYQIHIALIMEKKTAAEKKLEDLRATASRDDILKAQMSLIEHKVLEKMAQAQLGAAATLNDEKTKISVELDKQIQGREERLAEINAELENYETAIKREAALVLRRHYPTARALAHKALEDALNTIDEIDSDLRKWNRETKGNAGLDHKQLLDLLPRYSAGNVTKALAERLTKYFG